LDTAGFASWPLQGNSDTAWEVGAFNRGVNPGNPFDLGWGIYNIIIHQVFGDSIYLLQYPDNTVYKVLVESLISGTYTLRYAPLGVAADNSIAVTKSAFADRNLAYVSLRDNAVRDLEPSLSAWDFLLSTYVAMGQESARAGVLLNPNVLAAEARDVDVLTASADDYTPQAYINSIGQGWYQPEGIVGPLRDSLLYFLHRLDGSIVPIQFSALSLEAVTFGPPGETGTTGVVVVPASLKLKVWPNPAHNIINIALGDADHEALLSLVDLQGKVLWTKQANGEQVVALALDQFPRGTYWIVLQDGARRASSVVISLQ
jgi:hypothetical protein